MKYILSIIKFYQGKSYYQRFPYSNTWFKHQYHKVTIFLRRSFVVFSVIATLAVISGATATIYRDVYPKVVYADRDVLVEKDMEFPPILQKICNAEVTGNKNTPSHQFKKNGAVVRGTTTPSDIGYCQISEIIWNDKARELGYDIYTEKGNKDMALWLFLHYGSEPWYLSKSNWK